MKYWALVFLLFLFTEPSHAIEIEKKVLEKGSISYSYSLDEDGFVASYCKPKPNGLAECTCDADSTYPILHGGTTDKINKKIWQITKDYKCEEGATFSQLNYSVPQQKGPILSLLFEGTFLPVGGNGSCHSSSTAMVVNTQSDHIYTLSEVLDKTKEAQIKEAIVAYFKSPEFKKRYDIDDKDEAWSQDMLESAAEFEINATDRKFWERGFYIENGQLFINFGYHIFLCADSNNYSVPIARGFVINKDIAGLLTK